jgi:hypothetical protein
MSRLLVRLLAAVLVCEGVVLSVLAAAFFISTRVPLIGPIPEPPPVWVHAVQGAGVALWVIILGAGAHALWTGRYRAERARRRLLYGVVAGQFVVSFALPVWFGGLSFGRRDGLAALVFWLLGLACWAALHFASPRPEKRGSRGRRRPLPKARVWR